jgi:hypothetical protein
MGLFI